VYDKRLGGFMNDKIFVYIRFFIASLFSVALIAAYFLRGQGLMTTQDISIYGSFIIAIYAMVYGLENLFKRIKWFIAFICPFIYQNGIKKII
jgi:hypothetical protein